MYSKATTMLLSAQRKESVKAQVPSVRDPSVGATAAEAREQDLVLAKLKSLWQKFLKIQTTDINVVDL
jgi:hypothetical protein